MMRVEPVAYSEIATRYKHKLGLGSPDEEKKLSPESKKVSTTRNFFTGVVYDGQFARSPFRDWLAGGIKNNFLFGAFPKSKHADLIAVFDFISKVGSQQQLSLFFSEIDKIEDETLSAHIGSGKWTRYIESERDNALFDKFCNYFLVLQSQCDANLRQYDSEHLNDSDEASVKRTREEMQAHYARLLRDLKILINNFAQYSGHSVLKRIKRKRSGMSGRGLDITYEQDSFLDNQNYYELKPYKDKTEKRRIKTNNKRLVKIISLLAAMGDAFIIYHAITTTTFLLSFSIFLYPIGIIFALAGLYIYYKVYSHSLYKGLKELTSGNLLKGSDLRGGYKPLPWNQYTIAAGILLLSFGGGLCSWALTSYVISMTFLGAVSLSGIALALPVSIPILLALTFQYYCSIANGIKNWDATWAHYKAYLSDVKNGEKTFLSVLSDFLELLASLTAMTVLFFVGYVLFQERGGAVLNALNLSSSTQALFFYLPAILACVHSGVKWLFGVNKVIEMADNHLRSSVSEIVEAKELNPIQEKDRRCRTIYHYFFVTATLLNALGKGALYSNFATHAFDQLGGLFHTINQFGATTVATAVSEFAYMVSPALSVRKKESSVVPVSMFRPAGKSLDINDAAHRHEGPNPPRFCNFL